MRGNHRVRCLSWSAVVLLSTAAGTRAATIAAWDLAGEAGDQATTAGVGSANATALAMTRGPGLTATTSADAMSSGGWESLSAVNPADDEEYFEFGIGVADGFQVLVDELLIATRSSNTGPGTLGLFSSLDGFTTPIHTFVQSGSDTLNSAVALGGLSLTGDVQMRLIELGNTQADGSGDTTAAGTFRLANYSDGSDLFAVQLTGSTIAVPEPAGFLLLWLGLLLVALRRRRRLRA